MTEERLSPEDISQFDRTVLIAFAKIREVHELPFGDRIKYPQIPSELSKSIVLAVSGVLFGSEYCAALNENGTGNNGNTKACLANCILATCGDGLSV